MDRIEEIMSRKDLRTVSAQEIRMLFAEIKWLRERFKRQQVEIQKLREDTELATRKAEHGCTDFLCDLCDGD